MFTSQLLLMITDYNWIGKQIIMDNSNIQQWIMVVNNRQQIIHNRQQIIDNRQQITLQMGIQQSSSPTSPPAHFLQHYQIIQRSQNSEVTYLIHRQSKREHFMRVLTAHNLEERDLINRLATHKISSKSEYLIELNEKAEVRQEGYCSNQFKFYLIFQRPYKTLKSEIEERKVSNRVFSEGELEELLRTSIFGLMFLREINQTHENITTDNVFLSRAGDFFLSDPWLNFQPNVFTSINRVYDSPEKLEVKSNMTYKNINSYASDLFSLGMVMLQAIYLRSMGDAYNDKSINFTYIRERVNKIPYPTLKAQLEGLLDYKPKRRLAVAFQIEAFSDEKEESRYNLIPTFGSSKKQFMIKTAHRAKQVNTHQEEQRVKIFQGDQTRLRQESVATVHGNNLEKTKPTSQTTNTKKCNFQSQSVSIMIEAQSLDKPRLKSCVTTEPREELDESYIKVEQNVSILELQNSVPPQPPIEEIESEEEKMSAREQEPKQSFPSQSKEDDLLLSQSLSEEEERTPPKIENKKRKFQTTILEVEDSENNSCAEDQEIEFTIEKYQIGSKYQGYKKGGMKNGRGKFSYHDGGYYQGMWRNDKMNGEGKLYYSSGKLAYQGEWKDDEFYGHGKVYNDSVVMTQAVDYQNFNTLQNEWEYFEGNLVSDSKQGMGLIKFSSGEMFEGEFSNDKMEGKGKFHKKDGTVIHGLWKGSKFVVRL